MLQESKVLYVVTTSRVYHLFTCVFFAGKVFVTYEADSDEHLKEIIKFVALLRNNGFDTHVTSFVFLCHLCDVMTDGCTVVSSVESLCQQIDVFEEQLSSISKIDCMERYLNEVSMLEVTS